MGTPHVPGEKGAAGGRVAYAAEGTTAPDTGALPAAVRAKLDAVVGLNRVAQCTVLLYPPAQPSIGPSRGVA